MTKGEKQKFRMSSKWKSFRAKMKKQYCGFDFITRRPLSRRWNLHHLDMRDEHYTDTSDMSRFLPLCEDTHEFMHWLYRIWRRDKAVLKRIEHVLNRMHECTYDRKKEDI